MVEQRKNQRFELALPLRVLRIGAGQVVYSATTRNISSCGVLFECDREIAVGGTIEYVVALTDANGIKVDLRCTGKVVRLEKALDFGPHRIAATLDRYEFIRRAAA
ncbi:MAG TPA: PilZ domain-containing protein [Bryobacteraceae bacterium]|nr:PilZ domain-containing protein [Bryobacteraceae bacterium]